MDIIWHHWIVGCGLVAALIALVAWAADRIFRRPGLAHLLWMVTLLKLLMPPLVAFPIAFQLSFPTFSKNLPQHSTTLARESAANQIVNFDDMVLERDPSETAVALTSGTSLPLPASENISPKAVTTTPLPSSHSQSFTAFAGWQESISWSSMACWVWLTGTLAMAAWILHSAIRVRRLIEFRGRFDLEGSLKLKEITQNDQITRPLTPEVWLVDAVVSPMLYAPLCIGRKSAAKIIFPRALWQRLDDDAREVLLRHELAHWTRSDSWVRVLEMFAMVILWWHPLTWIAKRAIEDCEERCCDRAATATLTSKRRVYAEAILQTLDFLCAPYDNDRSEIQSRPIASGVGRLPSIEKRLKQIMGRRGNFPERWGNGLSTGFPLIPFAIGLFILLPVTPVLSLTQSPDPPASLRRLSKPPAATPSNFKEDIESLTTVTATAAPELESSRRHQP